MKQRPEWTGFDVVDRTRLEVDIERTRYMFPRSRFREKRGEARIVSRLCTFDQSSIRLVEDAQGQNNKFGPKNNDTTYA